MLLQIGREDVTFGGIWASKMGMCVFVCVCVCVCVYVCV